MKIKLLQDIPVQPVHGMTESRVLDAEEVGERRRGSPTWIVKGDTGETVGIMHHEAEVLDDSH